MSLRPNLFYYTGSPQVWVAPRGVAHVLVFAIGGGGGGGGGLNGNDTTTLSPTGGGGGGGAIEISRWVQIVPGRSYNVIVGEGGLGGAIGNDGTNGGDSYIEDSVTLDVIVRAGGAQGGEGGKNGAIAFGGMPVVPHSSHEFPTLAFSGLGLIHPGSGGWAGGRGTGPSTSWPGLPSIKGGSHISGLSMTDPGGGGNYPNVAGHCNGGPKAADSGAYAGGGHGGGGGAATICFHDTTGGAVSDNGGSTATGGVGNSSGIAGNGTGGGNVLVRPIGYGGAGGGGAGCGLLTIVSIGGTGTRGGHGRVVIIYPW